MDWIDRLRAHWESRPLATRMVGLIVALLALGITLAGTAMIGLLQRHLVAQIDSQLLTSVGSLATHAPTLVTGEDVPSPYYIRSTWPDGHETVTYYSGTVATAGIPNVPELLAVGELPVTGSTTIPVTVTSSIEGATWRAIAMPAALRGGQVGVLTVALPLTDVQHTLRTTTGYFAAASIIIVIMGGALGRYLVTRSLSGLHNIESIAGKFAAGDLTQRISPEPPTTEIGSLALSLNTMLSQVEHSFEVRRESERKVRRFVSDASHELRTPLAAIRGYCELHAMGGVPPERVDDVMGRIRSEATRMGSLVEDLLTLARLDEGRPLEIRDVDLVKMADNAALDLRALDPTRAVTFRSLGGRKPPMSLVIKGDTERLQQVFTNLIGNITRYTPEGSPVEIAVGRSQGSGVVEFRDHGPGIDEADHARVFERFYRTENSRARSLGGSGLGLAIVADVVRAHHGTVTLSRTKGGGLTVRVALPLPNSLHGTGSNAEGSEEAHAEEGPAT